MKQNSAVETSEKLIQSNARRAVLTDAGASASSMRPVAASANGTTLKNIQVQDLLSSSQP